MNQTETQILMCHRKKEPYKGLYNFVGGKLKPNESEFEAAYRELYEETAITHEDIQLNYLYKTLYYNAGFELQVFYGTLNKEVEVIEEVNPLHWIDFDQDFADISKFAGEGNIKHMLLLIKSIKEDSR